MRMQRSTVHRPRAVAAIAACLLVLAAPTAAQARGRHGHGAGAAVRVLRLVNEERELAGCDPLTLNRRLSASARRHSGDMAFRRFMSHWGSDGSAPVDRIRRSGYRPAAWGENVAYGYRTPEEVMDAWMTSPSHRRNILDCDYEEMGLGLAEPGDYWTQDFGTAR
ncbi:CAP domain-containing protein [Peterkaempfera bronchialis]|nr:CAP domain-containing protein [Peterkaempfera bronchialis]